ncbi:MAG: VOC family protein [Pseudomonadota bacterium]|nr:VOC family protein [Pseudomonadota bacterium]
MSTPQLAIHLSFDGTCAEAFAFYKATLGAEISMMMSYADSPMAAQVPAEQASRILHASLELGAQRIMGADAIQGHPYQGSQGFAVSLSYPTVDEARRVHAAMGEGGTIVMPFGPTFWARGFGMVTDRFSVTWMMSAEQPA